MQPPPRSLLVTVLKFKPTSLWFISLWWPGNVVPLPPNSVRPVGISTHTPVTLIWFISLHSNPTASCPCGAPVESILHFIFHCPIFSSLSSHTEQPSMKRVSRFCLSNQAPSQKTLAVSAGHELFIKIGHLNLSTSFLSGYAVGLQWRKFLVASVHCRAHTFFIARCCSLQRLVLCQWDGVSCS